MQDFVVNKRNKLSTYKKVHQGAELKRWVKAGDQTASEIAVQLAISRTQLYDLFSKESLSPYYLQRLTKLGLTLTDKAPTAHNNHNTIRDPHSVYGNQLNQTRTGIPVFSPSSTLSLKTILMSFDATAVVGYLDIPELNGAKAIIQHRGHEMKGEISHGDHIAIQVVDDRQVLIWGGVYLIMTKELLIVRFVFEGNKSGHWILRSTNPDKFPDIIINSTQASTLFIVTASVHINKFSNTI